MPSIIKFFIILEFGTEQYFQRYLLVQFQALEVLSLTPQFERKSQFDAYKMGRCHGSKARARVIEKS